MKPVSLVLVLLLSLGACKAKPANTGDPAAGSASGAATTDGRVAGAAVTTGATIPATDAGAAVQAAMQKLMDKGSYRVTMSAGEVATKAEVQLPDRLRIIAGGMGQVVVIGPDTYSEQNGQWSHIGTAASLGDILKQLVPDLQALVQNPRPLGSETLDGQVCDVYGYDSEQDLGAGKVQAAVKLWIARDSGLPRRQTVAGKALGQAVSLTSDFSYDGTISIEAPETFTELGPGPGPTPAP